MKTKQIHGSETDFPWKELNKTKGHLSQKVDCADHGRKATDDAVTKTFDNRTARPSLFSLPFFRERPRRAPPAGEVPVGSLSRSTATPRSRQSSDTLVRNQTMLLSQPASSPVSNRTNLGWGADSIAVFTVSIGGSPPCSRHVPEIRIASSESPSLVKKTFPWSLMTASWAGG